MDKKCYDCKYRGKVPGDAHSCCEHPDLKEATLASIDKFQIKANPTGIRRGWFNWPWNFDPVWLKNCNAFEEK